MYCLSDSNGILKWKANNGNNNNNDDDQKLYYNSLCSRPNLSTKSNECIILTNGQGVSHGNVRNICLVCCYKYPEIVSNGKWWNRSVFVEIYAVGLRIFDVWGWVLLATCEFRRLYNANHTGELGSHLLIIQSRQAKRQRGWKFEAQWV